MVRFNTVFLILFLYSCSGSDNIKSKSSNGLVEEIMPAEKLTFTRELVDTIVKIKEIDEIGGHPIGSVKNIVADSSYIYIIDEGQGYVYTLNREDLSFAFRIGDGEGRAPNNLNMPAGIFFDQDLIVVTQNKGMGKFSYFDKKGKYVKSVSRTVKDISVETDLVDSDDLLFRASSRRFDIENGVDHGNGIWVEVFQKSDLGTPRQEMIPSSDFAVTALDMERSTIYLHNDKQGHALYAAVGNRLLLNSYSYDGELKRRVDLSGIPELSLSLSQKKQFYEKSAGEGSDDILAGISIFNKVVFFENKVIFPYTEYADYEKFVSKPDIMYTKHNFAVIDLEKQTYDILKSDHFRYLLAEIDGKLWSFDRQRSILMLYDMRPKD